MFLVITGNINPDEVINIIKQNQNNKKFNQLKELKVKKYDEPKEVSLKKEEMLLNVSIPKCAIAYKIKLKDKKTTYQDLLYISTLFDAKVGATSEFSEKLKEEEIINDNLMIDFIHTDEFALFVIDADTNKPDVLLDKIINHMTDLKIDENEFLRKKKTLVSSLIYTSDNIFSINHMVMNDVIHYNKFNTTRCERVNDLNYEDFSNLIKNIDLSNYTTLVVNPKK